LNHISFFIEFKERSGYSHGTFGWSTGSKSGAISTTIPSSIEDNIKITGQLAHGKIVVSEAVVDPIKPTLINIM
jgi:hypothetical protein